MKVYIKCVWERSLLFHWGTFQMSFFSYSGQSRYQNVWGLEVWLLEVNHLASRVFLHSVFSASCVRFCLWSLRGISDSRASFIYIRVGLYTFGSCHLVSRVKEENPSIPPNTDFQQSSGGHLTFFALCFKQHWDEDISVIQWV